MAQATAIRLLALLGGDEFACATIAPGGAVALADRHPVRPGINFAWQGKRYGSRLTRLVNFGERQYRSGFPRMVSRLFPRIEKGVTASM